MSERRTTGGRVTLHPILGWRGLAAKRMNRRITVRSRRARGEKHGLFRIKVGNGLGVTCVWLQPFYPSPNKDNGYDVADYYGVHPKHGTLGQYAGGAEVKRILLDLEAA